jgi:hypothetical protein
LKNKKFRLLDFLIIALLLLTALVFIDMFRHDIMFTFNLQNVESVGTVVVRRNIVQRRLGNRVLWDRLNRESPVYLWDLIRVAEASAATLYIQDNSIDLEENTLIRIVPAPDGIGIQISMSYGTLSFLAGENSGFVILDLGGGRLIRPQPGIIFNARVTEDGQVFTQTIDRITREISQPQILSPSLGSTFLYNNNLPVVSFQWGEVEGAIYYIVEVCNSPDFINPRIQRHTTALFFTDSSLGDGTWYWRVTPVFPSIFGNRGDLSSVGSFHIERTDIDVDNPAINFSQWLVMVAPPPQETILPPPPPPRPPAPLPPAPLAAPQNRLPVTGTNFGMEELMSNRAIVFNWAAVPGANAYIYTLYQQTASGRRQVVRATVTGTSYTLHDLQLLDRGTFVWQVEAVNMTGNTIQRRGRIIENTFIIDFPTPGPVYIDDIGILHGN